MLTHLTQLPHRRKALARVATIAIAASAALTTAACTPGGTVDNDGATPLTADKADSAVAARRTAGMAHEPEFIKAVSGPDRPFSPAVRANGFLILSGQIGTDSTGNLVAGGIKAETRQTMENIKRTLEQNRSSMNRVVKCTVFLADMKEWGTVNEIYVTYFDPARRPARSAMGANGLALGSQVEIECLAVDG